MVRTRVPSREPAGVEPLRGGERLAADEFLRRYEATPGIHHIELIEGVVEMPSPQHADYHSSPSTFVVGAAVRYAYKTPGVRAYGGATFQFDDSNVIEPDLVLLRPRRAGARWQHTEDDYLAGVPDLVIEVSATTTRRDLGARLRLFERHAVSEYIAVLTTTNTYRAFRWADGRFVDWPADADGVLRSQTFPGLWLVMDALLRLDLDHFMDGLEAGLSSPEHAAFRAALAETAQDAP